MDKKPVKEID